MNRKIAVFAFFSLLISGTALATNGGNGSGNPNNDRAWNYGAPSTQPAAIFVWKDGRLVRNPNRDEQHASDMSDVAGKQ
ncbi:hypothetical protein M5G20_19265 [Pseudomonas sp. TNT2022 ID1044]|uniref:hypothetical protein n=1 Tax=Pseudomonas sp. TNT2022 ID1044 TaxID=2942636 RepID=UPI00236140B9|nr:hypothetical protein [Pseudomonas sp. TNT2022 ID1044]MDD0997988.1 hypothetical protein [Pseudomonas sp. TNT2022 ID1044]